VTVKLLDTNAASDLFSGRSLTARKAWFDARRAGDTVAISVITEAELLFGFRQRVAAERLRTAYDEFTSKVRVLQYDSNAAASYAALRTHLKEEGLVLAPLDLLIAAHSHAIGGTLVTRDKAFRHISSLVPVVNWAIDLN
jgi:tRNA(fMet)-specific endonuclease VapC